MRIWQGATDESRRDSGSYSRSRMSDELIADLRQRVEQRYYDQPQIIEIIAQAILHSRGLYL